MNYYRQESFLTTPIGNNTINFVERKEKWSDGVLRVPPLITGTIENVRLLETWICYEYVSDKDKLISSFGLESLVHTVQWDKNIFVVDNHNHAFFCRWKSYLEWKIKRWSHLIHIDQHSDLNEIAISWKMQVPSKKWEETYSLALGAWSHLYDVALYTNEVLDIASFIKPAKEIWLISDYEMVLTEYTLLNKEGRGGSDIEVWSPPTPLAKRGETILDVDLDFWAPEMGIEYYYQTIKKVRQLIALPDVGCITIATSPTYIHQQRAIAVLKDIIGENSF